MKNKKIYVVIETCGEYSSRNERCIGAFYDEIEAMRLVQISETEYRLYEQEHKAQYIKYNGNLINYFGATHYSYRVECVELKKRCSLELKPAPESTHTDS